MTATENLKSYAKPQVAAPQRSTANELEELHRKVQAGVFISFGPVSAIETGASQSGGEAHCWGLTAWESEVAGTRGNLCGLKFFSTILERKSSTSSHRVGHEQEGHLISGTTKNPWICCTEQ